MAGNGKMTTIVFDFGNVLGLFDYQKSLTRLTAHSDMSAADMYAALSGSFLWEEYETGRMRSAEFLGHLRALLRLVCDDDVISEAWCDIFQPNMEVCSLVAQLKPRYRLLLGSNTNELHAAWFRRQFADTLKYFDHLVLSHEVGVRKPHAGFYEHCQRKAEATPEQCVFIDDLPANIAAARQCGWHGILYRNFDDLQKELVAIGIL
jgi:putative hydrolase of the HAD superfamily